MTRVIREGEVIYQPGEFGTSFFTIVDGEVTARSGRPAEDCARDSDAASSSAR